MKKQNKALAFQNVQKGISYFKEDRIQDAKVSYNKALSIDDENVEAYVARGALSGNEGDFDKAIVDLEKALKLDENHLNAKTYLKEIILAKAVELEKSYRYEAALTYLYKSLEMDLKSPLVISKINSLKASITKMKEADSKNLYGPSLPAISHKDKRRRKGKSKDKRRSKSKSFSPEVISPLPSLSHDTKNNSQSHHKYYKKQRTEIKSKNSDKNKDENHFPKETSKVENSKSDDSDGEDLEDFFNTLKKNKANVKKWTKLLFQFIYRDKKDNIENKLSSSVGTWILNFNYLKFE